jgi:hypothetical protein
MHTDEPNSFQWFPYAASAVLQVEQLSSICSSQLSLRTLGWMLPHTEILSQQ